LAFNAINPVKLGSGEAAITPLLTTYRTTPSLSRDIVKSMDIAHNGASVATVSVYLVPAGDVAGVDNILVPEITLKPNSIFQWTGTQVVNDGDTIQAQASVAGVCLHISGGEAI